MPRCCFCSESYPSVNGLYHHLNLQHPSKLSKVLKCMEQKCLRLCKDWKQLRRHFIRDHKFPVRACGRLQCASVSRSDQCRDVIATPSVSVVDSENITESITTDGDDIATKCEDVQNLVLNKATSFMSGLYANPALPRNHVQSVFDDVKCLLQGIFSSISPSMIEVATSADSSELKEQRLKSIFDHALAPFEHTLSTEYRRFQFLRQSGYFIEPQDYVVGDRCDEKFRSGRMVVERVSVCGKYVPIGHTLSKFLSLPGILDKIRAHHSYLGEESAQGVISNFIQGKLWKRKVRGYEGKFVLPIFLYFDDFEVNNPLGSHAGVYKLGGVYFSLPSLPPEFQSSIENVFFTLLFHSSDRAVPADGNWYVFRKFIEDLNSLQKHGMVLEIDGRKEQIFFCVGLLLADNKGFHDVMGFAGGFNANYYCRLCKEYKENMKCQLRENKISLRQRDQYEQDAQSGLSVSGVAQNSIWNSLSNFHVYENFSVDVMHDMLQGICKTDMAIVLKHFICGKKSFSLASLNARINSFNYTICGVTNRPPCLTLEDVQDGNLSMYATEMFYFTILFSFYVGDLLEPDDLHTDNVWQLYITLREILDVAFSKTLQVEDISLFGDLVERHHRLRVEKLKCPLRPKDHFLIHYQTVMEMSGPVSHLSTAKFESKHKVLKTYAKNTTSRVNITHTVSMKEQLNFALRLASQRGLEHKLECGPGDFYCSPSLLDSYLMFSSSLPASFNGPCIDVSWVKDNGITYRKDSVLAVDVDCESCPVFACIKLIILDESSEVCFVCKLFSTLSFSEDLHAYAVSETSELKCFKVNELMQPYVAIHHVLSSGVGYVIKKHLM